MQTYCVFMDDHDGFDQMTPHEQYDASIRSIAKNAPLRVCEHELISGAATLGMATHELIPAKWKKEKLWNGISHLTLDFKRVLQIGMDGIERSLDGIMSGGNFEGHRLEVLEFEKYGGFDENLARSLSGSPSK